MTNVDHWNKTHLNQITASPDEICTLVTPKRRNQSMKIMKKKSYVCYTFKGITHFMNSIQVGIWCLINTDLILVGQLYLDDIMTWYHDILQVLEFNVNKIPLKHDIEIWWNMVVKSSPFTLTLNRTKIWCNAVMLLSDIQSSMPPY